MGRARGLGQALLSGTGEDAASLACIVSDVIDDPEDADDDDEAPGLTEAWLAMPLSGSVYYTARKSYFAAAAAGVAKTVWGCSSFGEEPRGLMPGAYAGGLLEGGGAGGCGEGPGLRIYNEKMSRSSDRVAPDRTPMVVPPGSALGSALGSAPGSRGAELADRGDKRSAGKMDRYLERERRGECRNIATDMSCVVSSVIYQSRGMSRKWNVMCDDNLGILKPEES
ncbi:hypothetical protein FOCC_FOCC004898 [Frankliniella occidentalis]|nr:hypothetical protein FOCC_FOCC004898 [Frankliniella occidentalis]